MTLRVACLGAGYFAQFHHDAWRRIDGAALIATADHDPARGADFTDLGTMLNTVRPDILDVVIPPTGHLAAIRDAVAAGVAAIICQKPFCTTRAEAIAATNLAEAVGIPLIIHENFRFQPWYRAIRTAIADGRVGDLHQITFRLRPGDGQGPGAYLDRQPYFQTMARFLVHETAVHWLDTFRFLMGMPDTVYADLRRLNPAIAGEDAGHILLGYGDGRRAMFDGNRHLDHAATAPRLTMGEALVEGTGATIALTGDGALHLRRFGDITATEILPASDRPGFGGDCVRALQAHVVEGLTKGAPLENLARDYLNVLTLEAAVYRAATTGTRQKVQADG
ncbi:MAG: putative dehydrogenase [Paracoccaceae bacterium]